MVENFKITHGQETDTLADGDGAYDGLHPSGADNSGRDAVALEKPGAELKDGRIAVHQNERHLRQSVNRKRRRTWGKKLPAKL